MLLTLLACTPELVAVEALSVIHVAPSHGSTGVAVDSTLAVTFSAELDTDTLTEATLLLQDEDGTVPTDLSYEAGSFTVYVTPQGDLTADAAHELVVTDAVGSVELGALPATLRSGFDTSPAPAQNDRPFADAGGDRDDCVIGQPLELDGGGSYDPENRLGLGFSWRMVDAPEAATWTLDGDDTQAPTLTVDRGGEYLVGLIVDDGELSSDEDYAVVWCTEAGGDTGL